jgi:DNA-binding GntR family transcriptional regulator
MYDWRGKRTEMSREKPRTNSSERQKIVRDLKAGIASGKFKPGQRLVEAHLSEVFGVKRSKVREALRKLEQDGFVKIIPNVGAIVAEFSQKDIEHIYDLMSVLEGLAVRVITPFITAEQIETIEALVNKVETVDEAPLFFESNNELHSFFIALSENDELKRLADNFMSRIRCLNLQCLFSPGQMAASVKEHRRILEAIKGRKAVKAEQLMRNHLVGAKNRLTKYLNKSL